MQRYGFENGLHRFWGSINQANLKLIKFNFEVQRWQTDEDGRGVRQSHQPTEADLHRVEMDQCQPPENPPCSLARPSALIRQSAS